MEVDSEVKAAFKQKLVEILNSKSNALESIIPTNMYQLLLEEVRAAQKAKAEKLPLTTKQYRRLNNFDILSLGGLERLICSKSKTEIKYYASQEECFDIIHTTHLHSGHKRERVMEIEMKKKYRNVTRDVLNAYLNCVRFANLSRNILRKDWPLNRWYSVR